MRNYQAAIHSADAHAKGHLIVTICSKRQAFDQSESRIMNMFETDLTDALRKVCALKFIRRTNRQDCRDVWFDVDNAQNAESVLQQFMYLRKPLREFSYQIIAQ